VKEGKKMRANIVTKNVAFIPRPGVVTLSAMLVVLLVLAAQVQVGARADSGGTSSAVSPTDEGAGTGSPDTPEDLTRIPDTAVMTRWTVDCGGAVAATGDGYELSGTIGQPDAGLAGGGELTLSGGFWFPLADGDCNTDGGVDLIDFDGFQPCLSGPNGGVRRGCRCFDVDQDADVDLSDWAAFQQAFTGS
jgi:hypothetical protein